MAVLSVNAGSSSLKFALYPVAQGRVQVAVLSGAFEGLEPAGQPRLSWLADGHKQTEKFLVQTDQVFAEALLRLQALLRSTAHACTLQAVAHRVVHGGPMFTQPTLVTTDVLKRLAQYSSLAPLHQPHNLAGIDVFVKAFPGLPQIACFDTAFHATIPALHSSFALPQNLRDQGLRRYGFHGLSYQFIMSQLQQCSTRAHGRVLMAHLGNGASLCAAINACSVATSMGFSALDGLMMGTRSGTLDPGVLLHLQQHGWRHEDLEKLLYKESGLLGVSGLSADMRTLRQSQTDRSRFAIDLFTHRLVREAGAMIACMQGLDVIALSGGIGENDAALRAQMGQQMAWLGVDIDPQLNQNATGPGSHAIHRSSSAIEVWVIPTDEGRVAAQQAVQVLSIP